MSAEESRIDASPDIVIDGPEAPEAELERLRALVGPNESSYADLVDQLAAARDANRDAELRAGEFRGQLTQLRSELQRARQDQYHISRLVVRPFRAFAGRFARRSS